MTITRRHIWMLASTALVPLAACSGSATTPTQIVTDAQNAISALAASLQAVLKVSPTALPGNTVAQINAAIAAAAQVLGGLSTSLAATQAAPIVQKVEQAINTVVTTAASIPLIPPPFSLALSAASVVLPILEGFVNQWLQPAPAGASPAAMAARARMRALEPGMSVTAAEAKLAELAGR